MSNPPDTALKIDSLKRACARIAPNWPLDQLIAVNPWWGWRDMAFDGASARLAALGHINCLMPIEQCPQMWPETIRSEHLQAAANELDVPFHPDSLLAPETDGELRHWYNVSDFVDAQRPADAMSWHEEIIHQISQFCGDLMQDGAPESVTAASFYAAWLQTVRADRGLSILMDEPGLQERFATLPDQMEALFEGALGDLAVEDEHTSEYALALLLDINGWAANLAWLDWQANLRGERNDALLGLVAVRLAWDWILWQRYPEASWRDLWQVQWRSLPTLITAHVEHQRKRLVWHRAAEIARQCELVQQLSAAWPPPLQGRPKLQAAFCIDVRSEVIRRALERQDPDIRTLGFAGFFGLPLAYRPAGSDYSRPQLPGLLAPAIEATEVQSDTDRLHDAETHNQWQRYTGSAPSTFAAVESVGLSYAFKLLKQTLRPGRPEHPVNRLAPDARFALSKHGESLSLDEKSDLAATVLNAMGLRGEIAPRILLVGHGSTTCNNPHAAGLDCGACGGQTGEVNVRVLAQLLNDTDVREALAARAINIPRDTRFVAALHDTTTDEITCFPQAAEDIDEKTREWLDAASELARRERAPALGIRNERSVKDNVIRRSRSFSEVRPEWGLAGNDSFIVAPRIRTRHLDLRGRSFLHDYDWRQDADFSLLELIMTAPMIVTHWINMQYNASVTDPQKFGSGNKVLHNIVGGNLGVFEGNGGDLRIGLPLQSVHDGSRWVHDPLRLSVFIAAPEDAIRDVYSRHENVRQVVDNDWLCLFRLGDSPGEISRLKCGEWIDAQDPVLTPDDARLSA